MARQGFGSATTQMAGDSIHHSLLPAWIASQGCLTLLASPAGTLPQIEVVATELQAGQKLSAVSVLSRAASRPCILLHGACVQAPHCRDHSVLCPRPASTHNFCSLGNAAALHLGRQAGGRQGSVMSAQGSVVATRFTAPCQTKMHQGTSQTAALPPPCPTPWQTCPR